MSSQPRTPDQIRASIAATTEELRAGGAAGATSFREHLGGAGDTLAGVITARLDRLDEDAADEHKLAIVAPR